jgi:pilus assembly protein Flp/PilA
LPGAHASAPKCRSENAKLPSDKGFRERFENFFTPVSRPGAQRKPGGTVTALLKRFAGDESGATAIEYGLIAAGISVAIITVVQGLGTKLNSTFGTVKNALK